MEKGDHSQIEEYSVPVYEFSEKQEANLRDAWKKDQNRRSRTQDVDRTTKVSALKASSFVVSLFSFSGDVLTGRGVGTIIETDRNVNTVISSLNVIKKPINEEYPETYHRNELVDDVKVVVFSSDDNVYLGEVICWDFHYNVFVLKFQSRLLLKPAELAWISEDDYQASVLRPHSRTVKSGEPVVIVGRYFNDLEVVSGLFSLCPELKFHNCFELVTSTAKISKSGEGAPVINLRGAVVGIAYYACDETSPILPIEVANKWWSHYKQHKESRHLSYGFVCCQLFSASISFLEKFRADFPNIDNGVLLGCVFENSSADSAGLLEDDVIVNCDGKPVQAFLELWSLMWDKVGDAVELEVARVGSNKIQVIRMEVGETNELYRWSLF